MDIGGDYIKVVFLDFDGVLNDMYPNNPEHRIDYPSFEKVKIVRNAKNFIYDELKKIDSDKDIPGLCALCDLDYEKVIKLNRLVEETDCYIVFSTAWRGNPHLPLFLAIMGFLYPERCIDHTKWLTDRGEEIQEWLNRNPTVAKYAIVDDEISDIVNYHVKESIFKVRGLTCSDIDNVVRWLNS